MFGFLGPTGVGKTTATALCAAVVGAALTVFAVVTLHWFAQLWTAQGIYADEHHTGGDPRRAAVAGRRLRRPGGCWRRRRCFRRCGLRRARLTAAPAMRPAGAGYGLLGAFGDLVATLVVDL